MKYKETDCIRNIDDVKDFASYLINDLDVNLHPDNDFAEYRCYATGKPTFTDKEVSICNRLMEECFEVCKNDSVDIYDLTLTILKNKILL